MSTYDPRRQGIKDARRGGPRYQHKSAYNQRIYDLAYDAEERRVESIPFPAASEPDYEDLLTRYIALVGDQAGDDYIRYAVGVFTEEELAVLWKMAEK